MVLFFRYTLRASGVDLLLLRPLFMASFSQAALYQSPSNLIFLEDLIYSLSTLNIASSFFRPFLSIKASTSTLKALSCLATIVFKIIIGLAQLALDPTALNSNLLPVKAKLDVRFLSVLS